MAQWPQPRRYRHHSTPAATWPTRTQRALTLRAWEDGVITSSRVWIAGRRSCPVQRVPPGPGRGRDFIARACGSRIEKNGMPFPPTGAPDSPSHCATTLQNCHGCHKWPCHERDLTRTFVRVTSDLVTNGIWHGLVWKQGRVKSRSWRLSPPLTAPARRSMIMSLRTGPLAPDEPAEGFPCWRGWER